MKKKHIVISIALIVVVILVVFLIMTLHIKQEREAIYQSISETHLICHSEIHEKRSLENPYYVFDTYDSVSDYAIVFLDECRLRITKKGNYKIIDAKTKEETSGIYDDSMECTYQINVNIFGKATIKITDAVSGKTSKNQIYLSEKHSIVELDGQGLFEVCNFLPTRPRFYNVDREL